MQVLWSNEQSKQILPDELENLLVRVGNHVAEKLSLPENSEVSVAFVDDETIAELNANYRGKTGPTDVLSFAFADGEPDPLPEGAPLMLGDIIISAERAQAQAAEFGHSIEREIVFLLVHGLLHLAEYDHDEENEGDMKALNEEIVHELGYLR